MRRQRWVASGACVVLLGCAEPEPLKVALAVAPESRALVVVERGADAVRAIAVDPSTLAGTECLDSLARQSHEEENVEWAALSFAQTLAELCLEPGCLELLPDSAQTRALPAPAAASLRKLERGVLDDWTETSLTALPAFVANARVERCARPPSPAVEISSGGVHTCARLEDRSVWCWGDNAFGQLGDGTFRGSTNPVKVSGLEDVGRIDLGDFTSCATVGREVFCWGRNDFGQLGRLGDSSATPVRVAGVERSGGLAVGRSHVCVGGDIPGTGRTKPVCWGRNESGELGNGSTAPVLGPTDTANITDLVGIAVGRGRTCAVVDPGDFVQCWGDNQDEDLFPGSEHPVLTPRTVEGLTDIGRIVLGHDAQCVAGHNSQVQCWGTNNKSQVGDGSSQSSPVPVPLQELSVSQDIDGGGYGFCATRNFVPLCWGRDFGPRPTQVDGLPASGVEEVSPAAGLTTGIVGTEEVPVLPHACARTVEGVVYCWGGNVLGQLGRGTISEVREPPAPVRW